MIKLNLQSITNAGPSLLSFLYIYFFVYIIFITTSHSLYYL